MTSFIVHFQPFQIVTLLWHYRRHKECNIPGPQDTLKWQEWTLKSPNRHEFLRNRSKNNFTQLFWIQVVQSHRCILLKENPYFVCGTYSWSTSNCLPAYSGHVYKDLTKVRLQKTTRGDLSVPIIRSSQAMKSFRNLSSSLNRYTFFVFGQSTRAICISYGAIPPSARIIDNRSKYPLLETAL